MLLRSDWLILSEKDWCCINRSVSVSLPSPLPKPLGYIISDRQHKQETRVTQVPDAAEQTSICASWGHIYIYPVKAGCRWTALVRSWDRWWQWADKWKSLAFTGYHVSLRFFPGSLMSCSFFSASWPWPKENHAVTASFLLCSLRAASSLGTHRT